MTRLMRLLLQSTTLKKENNREGVRKGNTSKRVATLKRVYFFVSLAKQAKLLLGFPFRSFLFSKKQWFVLIVFVLSLALFFSESFVQAPRIFIGIVLSVLTDILLYLVLKRDLKFDFSSVAVFILPFLYTFSFNLFYLLIPFRFITRVVTTGVFAFGLYSLFLTQNIFAVSSLRTITLMRSARIILFVITTIVCFLSMNIIFSFRTLIYLLPLFVFSSSFLLSYQLFWAYNLGSKRNKEVIFYSFINSLIMLEISVVLLFWPLNATVYSLFLTGVFYIISGLSNTWFDQRLFKSVLWEYVWVGFLVLFMLFVFSEWGI